MDNFIKNRENSMKWWNKLTFEKKYIEIIKNKEKILGYPTRDPNTLTSREINIIYNNL